MASDVGSILQAIQGELVAIREEFRQLREEMRPKRCTAQDLENLEKLLPAAAGLFGSAVFRVRDLLADPGISGLGLGGRQALGNLLSRAAADSITVSGLVVMRSREDHGSVLWWVARRSPAMIEASRNSGHNHRVNANNHNSREQI